MHAYGHTVRFSHTSGQAYGLHNVLTCGVGQPAFTLGSRYLLACCESPCLAQTTVACAGMLMAIRSGQLSGIRSFHQPAARALQVVGAGLQDTEGRVRGQAAFALGQLAAHCQPEAGRAAREALPAVIALMRDPDATVQQQACYALEALCEHMGAITFLFTPVQFLVQVFSGSKRAMRSRRFAKSMLSRKGVGRGVPGVAHKQKLHHVHFARSAGSTLP